MSMRSSIALVVILGAGSALPAAAQSMPDMKGFYVGAGIGQAKAKDACEGLGGTGISCDDTDTAWKILGGYQINRNFAAEIGYTKLGKATASGFGLTDEIKANAWELVGVGSFPVADRLSIFGKLGVYRADVKENTNFVGNFSHTNNDLTFGFGVRFDFTPNLGVRAEWQRYNDVGGGDIDKSDADVMALTALWMF